MYIISHINRKFSHPFQVLHKEFFAQLAVQRITAQLHRGPMLQDHMAMRQQHIHHHLVEDIL